MTFEWISRAMDSGMWMDFLEKFVSIGPIAGILLIMLECFVPMLPLFAFVAINVMAYGFWLGYLYSWIGNVLGSILLFFIIKKYGSERFHKKIQKSKRLNNIFGWIEKHGFFPIFILLTFPFTPSFVVCGLSALAGIKNRTFIYAILFGKLIMILSLSFIGYNLTEFIKQPVKSITLIVLTLSFSLIAKFIIGKYEKRLERRRIKNETDPSMQKKIA